MRTTTETLSRQWLMLKKIPAYPRSISTGDIHQYLRDEGHDVELRTIQRDLNRLSTDFSLTCEMAGRANYWQWAKGANSLEIPSMTPSAALMFKLVEQYLKPLLPRSTLRLMAPYLERSTEVMKATQFQGWRKNVRMLGRGPNLIPPRISNEVREVVYAALMENKRFQVNYRPRQKKAVKYEVNPQGLVVKDGITYVVSTLWNYDDLKHLALHRMRLPELLDKPGNVLKGFSLADYLETESSFAYPVTHGKLRLKVRLDSQAAFHLRESKLSADQKLEGIDEASVILTATVADSSEIRWWLLGFGDQVEVLEPAELRREFTAIVDNLKKFYSS